MFNLQSPIDRTTISGIAELLSSKKEDVRALTKGFPGNHQDNGKQIVIKLNEHNLTIEYTVSTATFIAIHGKFNLSIPELIDLYVTFRKVYVPYDDNYEFFFNEDKQKGSYILNAFVVREDYEKTDQVKISRIHLQW